MPELTFVTGTDTGVGKTLLTGLLLQHLRRTGVHALAMKPFCSGGTADVELLDALQEQELPTAELNPFYLAEPMSPLACLRKTGRRIGLSDVTRGIRGVAKRCEYLLIEGSGGLMVPLGEGFEVLDLIQALGCQVIVVSGNKLGTLNHTLLTVRALLAAGICRLKVVLMDAQPRPVGVRGGDVSRSTNLQLLRELLAPIEVLGVPFLGRNASKMAAVKKNEKKIKKTLAQILDYDIVSPTFFASLNRGEKKLKKVKESFDSRRKSARVSKVANATPGNKSESFDNLRAATIS